jgi:hypothetical protein
MIVRNYSAQRAANCTACVALALALLLLVACGRTGSPQPPPGVPNTYPKPYPRE